MQPENPKEHETPEWAELDYFQQLPAYLITKNKCLLNGFRAILSDLFREDDVCAGTKCKKAQKAVQVLALALYKAWEDSPSKYVTVSRNNNDYSGAGGFAGLGVTAATMSNAMDLMERHGYLEIIKGDRHWNSKNRRQTRIRALPKFLQVIQDVTHPERNLERLISEDVRRYESASSRPRIILKDENKKPVLITRMPAHIRESENLLKRYQKLLDKTSILLPEQGEIPLYDRFQYRVFNNSRFDHGGRLYGGAWQQCRSNVRKDIKIDHQKTVEIDLKATFPVLIYHQCGIDYWNEVKLNSLKKINQYEPYYLAGFTDHPELGKSYRNALKIIFGALVFYKHTKSSIRNIENTLASRIKEELDKKKLTQDEADAINANKRSLVTQLIQKHERIKDQFYCMDTGMHAMYLESEVTLKIIEKLLDKKILVLTVFDSYIVRQQDEGELLDAIVNQYHAVTGFTPFMSEK